MTDAAVTLEDADTDRVPSAVVAALVPIAADLLASLVVLALVHGTAAPCGYQLGAVEARPCKSRHVSLSLPPMRLAEGIGPPSKVPRTAFCR